MPARPRSSIITAVAVLVVLVAVLALLRLRPPTATTVRSLATACRRDYGAARSAGDSLVVDARVWEMDKGWRRIPSCGELRRAGTL